MEYLYFLQNLRESSPTFVTMFFVLVSEFIAVAGIMIPAVIYWCVDKKAGHKMFFNIGAAKSLADSLKLVICRNRPWILDSRLHLAKEVEGTATGYSTPSGHTTMGTAVYGSVAVWKKEKKGIVILCVIMTLLTAFARNWLGAHTLLDVSLAILLSVLAIIAVSFVLDWVDKGENRDLLIFVAILVGSAVVLFLVTAKRYPVEYLEDGTLLVDPVVMMRDCYEAVGILVGWAIAWFIERRCIDFTNEGTKAELVIRAIAGVVCTFLVNQVILKLLLSPIDPRAGKLIRTALTMIFIGVIYPLIFRAVSKKLGEKKN